MTRSAHAFAQAFPLGERRSRPAIAVLAMPAPGRDWDRMEQGMARALAAIRDCARIAWWDGSAVGLRLNGLLGLFETEAPDPHRTGDRR